MIEDIRVARDRGEPIAFRMPVATARPSDCEARTGIECNRLIGEISEVLSADAKR